MYLVNIHLHHSHTFYYVLQFVIICLLTFDTCHCLKITLLDIPNPLVVGESAELTCNYELEDNVLYSFKWYKDGIEFYRYVPRDYPQIQYLKMSGINVDVRKSTKKSVFLQNVNLNTQGKYRCEISAEAPSFVTAAKEGMLKINVLPTMGPKIHTGQSDYTAGDEIVVNCTSDKSNLDIHLNFTINGESVTNGIDYELTYSTQLNADSLKTAGLSLRFILNERHFRQGKLKLRCIASIPMYHIQNEANYVIRDHNYRSEQMSLYGLDSQSARFNVANDIHRDKYNTNDIKTYYILFSMYLHWQLQRLFF